MSAMLLLFVQNPQIALMTPQGLRHGYEPFWASHWWLADSGHKNRVITAQEYRGRVLRSDDEALRLRCGERGMEPAATREETVSALLAFLQDLPRPDHLDVATWAELVQECRLLNLNAAGSEEEMRERIRNSGPPAAAADSPPSDLAEETAATAPPVIEPAEIQAPAPVAAAAASKAVASPEQIAQLKALLAADDYNGVWSLATNLTETRPADKSKARVMGWARELLASLEG